MRLIQGNKVFAEWWNNWMSRLHSVHITTAADIRCQALRDRGYGQVREENSNPSRTASLEIY